MSGTPAEGHVIGAIRDLVYYKTVWAAILTAIVGGAVALDGVLELTDLFDKYRPYTTYGGLLVTFLSLGYVTYKGKSLIGWALIGRSVTIAA